MLDASSRNGRTAALLIGILAATVLAVVGVTISALYSAALDEVRARLGETARSHARLIEAIARFDEAHGASYPFDPASASMLKIEDAHAQYTSTTRSGEFTLARRDGDDIVFLLPRRFAGASRSLRASRLPWDSDLAEPMRRALAGGSGTVIGPDYRGARVLAAYEPVAELDLGIVAKIDLAEIRAPFVRAAVLAGVVALLSITLGSLVFLRTTRAMSRTLETSEAKYRDLFERAQDIILLLGGPQRTILDINETGARQLGSPRDSLIGRGFASLLPAESGEPGLELDLAGEALTTGALRRADGTRLEVEVSASEIRRDGQRVILCHARDISARRETERALRDAETRLREVAESTTDAFWVTTPDYGETIYVSPGYATIWGRSCESLYAHPRQWSDAIHPEDREETLAALAEEPRGMVELIYRIVRPDGGVRWVRDRAFPVYDERGDLVRMAGVALDITAQKRAEQEIRDHAKSLEVEVTRRTEVLMKTEAQFRDLVETSHGMVFRVDPEARIVYVNRAWETALGLPREQLLGRSIFDFTLSARREPELAAIRQALSGELRGFETMYRAGDGAQRHMLINARALRDSEGRAVGAQGVALDITERKLAHERQRRLEAQLYEAQKLEAVGRLAGGIAHDFNNMLSVIITEVFLLRAMQPETTPELEELSIILETAERAASLTRGLLAFSRRQILRPRPLVLTDVVRRMEGIVLRTLGEEIEYEFQTRDELWKVYADANQLEQVLLNLCINARDAMPKGGRLVVTTRNYRLAGDRSEPEAQLPSGDYVELAVTDTGAGIPAEIVDKIFEPFFSTKAPGKGTGLGLAVAHGVVSQSGGFMLVDTSPGEGTTFRILLPRHDGVDTPPADADPDEPLPHGRETILLVEDDDAVRESVRKLLERTGYTVLEAEHGEAALAVLRRAPEPPELVISDVIMPRMGGVELAARLRELAPTIKLLFVSGYNDLAVERCGELVEHARLLLKPFTPHELLHAVRAALQPPPPDERA